MTWLEAETRQQQRATLRQALAAARRRALKPPPRLTVSQWADAYRFLSRESSAEPGRWRTIRNEPSRGVMDAVSDPKVWKVVLCCSAQVGKTEIILNALGFHIDQDPAPILLVQPTVEMAEAFSRERLAPMLRDTPALHGKVADPRARDSENTLRHKVFPGGFVAMAGANSPAGLASRPIRLVLLDEVDKYPFSAGAEGDPVTLATKRSQTFWNRKVVLASTPTVGGRSKIQAEYDASDRQVLLVPCPACGDGQQLVWSQVQWPEGDPQGAVYVCEHCGSPWSDVERWSAVRQAVWVATAEFKGVAGFHWNALASSWVRLGDMAEKFLAAKGNPEALKAFVNTELGQVWQDRGEAPEWQVLMDRAADYALKTVPAGVVFLTCGVDVQKDRIEAQVWGWGRGKCSALVDVAVFAGDPATPDPWVALTSYLGTVFAGAAGREYRILRTAVDSGYLAQNVYHWAFLQPASTVMVVKGVDVGQAMVGLPKATDVTTRGKVYRRGVKVWPVNVSMVKAETYAWLRMARGDGDPEGWITTPAMEAEWFQQLTAEQLVTRVVRGYQRTEWQKTRERNEALDCRVYARAAAANYGLDRFRDGDFEALEMRGASAPAPGGDPRPTPDQQQRRGSFLRRGRGWLDR